MRISKALSTFAGNFARPTKYNAIITFPSALSINPDSGNQLDVLCKTITSPSAQNDTYDIKIKGHTLKLPGRTNQSQEISVTFYVDEYYTVKGMFQDWIHGIDNRSTIARNGPSSGLVSASKGAPNARYGNIVLIGRDFIESPKQPIVFEFEDVFPTSVSELPFDTAGKDSVLELTVTFAYYRALTTINGMKESIENLDDYLDMY